MADWSEITLTNLPGGFRLDPEYYQPSYLELERALRQSDPVPVGSFAYVTDGIHGSPEWVENDGVTYLSAKCVKDNEIVLDAAGQISKAQDAANPRTRACVNDVLVTSVGTIGNAAVVDEDVLPANMDRHLGIIRIQDRTAVDPYYLATFLNCKFGRYQTFRESTGNVQLNLFIDKINKLLVPIGLQFNEIGQITRRAYALRKESKRLYQEATQTLLDSLGLTNLDFTHDLYSIANIYTIWHANRLDSDYFESRYDRLHNWLARFQSRRINEVASLRQEKFIPETKATFDYIEISDVDLSNGLSSTRQLWGKEAPDRAQQIVRPGDVIVSTVRPLRGGTALIQANQDGSVCSSGFAVLQPQSVSSEYLLTYLRLPIIRELINRDNRASMYPAVTVQDILQIPIVIFPELEAQITDKIKQSHRAFFDAGNLLKQAKEKVEVMIESGVAYA